MQKSLQYILMTPREWQFGGYARDRWQVSRKMTVNIGLRYEFYPLMTRAAGKGIRASRSRNQPGLPRRTRGRSPRCRHDGEPEALRASLGIAYRLNDKTVIRTGYGFNYDPLPFSRPLRGFYPLTVNFNFVSPNGYAPVGTLAKGIPPVFGPDLSTGVVELPAEADMRSPYKGEIHRGYIQSWNFTVEHKLPPDIVVTAGYVGTQSTHMLADLDINAGYPGSGTCQPSLCPAVRRTTATNMWDGYLSANYHSLQSPSTSGSRKGSCSKAPTRGRRR